MFLCLVTTKRKVFGVVEGRILSNHHSGKSYKEMVQCFASERHATTKVGVYECLKCYEEMRMISHASGSSQPSKTIAKSQRVIEEQMERDDRTTGKELQKLLSQNGIGVVSSTAVRWQTELGWTSKGTSYCQMIQDVNKEQRLEWARVNKDMSFALGHL